MAFLQTKNVKIAGISAAVPKNIERIIDLDVYESREEAEKFIASSHIEERRVSNDDKITSDYCLAAAEKLIADLNWDKNDIDCLIFVSYTFDYILPSTACILQDRLGLSKDCYTLDVRYGCTGWVYGVSVISSLLQSGTMKKGLLLTGEVATKVSGRYDKSTYPLFGDCGSCTAFEYTNDETEICMHYGTDGSGYSAIIIPEGGLRVPFSVDSLKEEQLSPGIRRNKLQQDINGMDVFAFGISRAPMAINALTEHFKLNTENIDYYLLHQANFFMNQRILKRLKVSEDKAPCSIPKFGNNASASIPLLMVTQISEQLETKKLKSLACGFGVGLSWGSLCFETNKIIVPDLIEI